MSKERWLLIDSQNLAHRLFHALPPMEGPYGRSEVIFGFLRDVRKLQEKFKSTRIAFFFDYGKPLRCNLLPEYKANREASREKRKGTDKDDKHLQHQINLLRTWILPRLGFNNVVFTEGYEADDLIAAFHLYTIQGHGESVIVSSDKDFYQCLQYDLAQYDPRTEQLHDGNRSYEEYGLLRSQFVTMKAIAGCVSDNIPGVEGVGDKTAIKYILDELPRESAKFKSITKNKKLIERNTALVGLPWPDTPNAAKEEDSVTDKKWKKVLRELGITKIRI